MTPQPLPANLDLNSISMVSPAEGWAVGHTTPPPNVPGSNVPKLPPGSNYIDPVILHYHQGYWSQVPFPKLDQDYGAISLNGISMVSASEGWAVGNSVLPPGADGFTVGVLLHYTNGQWQSQFEMRASGLSQVLMRSASDGWILGSGAYDSGDVNLILHYDGKSWEPMAPSPHMGSINFSSMSITGESMWFAGIDYGIDIGGVGFDGDSGEAIVHYDGHAWTREKTNLGNSRLGDVLMLSPTEGWAVGGNPGRTLKHISGPPYGLILHYYNGVWEDQAHIPAPANSSYFMLSSVAMVSSSKGWIVGMNGTILRYQAGAWTQVASPTTKDLSSVVMLSATEGWAVGIQSTLLHYVNGAWNLVNQ